MTDILTLQKEVGKLYKQAFGRTPLVKRLEYIRDEALELAHAPDMKAMKDEAGDLLSCLLAFMEEMDLSAEDILQANLDKIFRRFESGQYSALGRKTQVCLIGGAFDPPHIGHYKFAEFLLSVRTFDEVWFVPAFKHMHGKEMTDASHRLEMLKLMTKNNGRIKVFDYEIRHKLAGETYHFLNRLLNDPEYSDQYSFSYAIGLDNANHFDQWVNYELLKNLIPFVVVARKGVKPDPEVDWYREGPHKFFAAEVDIPCISSSEIRDALLNPAIYEAHDYHIELEDMRLNSLGEEVYKYIIDNNLYQPIGMNI